MKKRVPGGIKPTGAAGATGAPKPAGGDAAAMAMGKTTGTVSALT